MIVPNACLAHRVHRWYLQPFSLEADHSPFEDMLTNRFQETYWYYPYWLRMKSTSNQTMLLAEMWQTIGLVQHATTFFWHP